MLVAWRITVPHVERRSSENRNAEMIQTNAEMTIATARNDNLGGCMPSDMKTLEAAWSKMWALLDACCA